MCPRQEARCNCSNRFNVGKVCGNDEQYQAPAGFCRESIRDFPAEQNASKRIILFYEFSSRLIPTKVLTPTQIRDTQALYLCVQVEYRCDNGIVRCSTAPTFCSRKIGNKERVLGHPDTLFMSFRLIKFKWTVNEIWCDSKYTFLRHQNSKVELFEKNRILRPIDFVSHVLWSAPVIIDAMRFQHLIKFILWV